MNDVTIQRFNVSALRTFEAALSSRVSLASFLFSAPLQRFNDITIQRFNVSAVANAQGSAVFGFSLGVKSED